MEYIPSMANARTTSSREVFEALSTVPDPSVDVTPEMVAAGMKVLALWDVGDPWDWIVTEVYRAMDAARVRSSPPGGNEGDPA